MLSRSLISQTKCRLIEFRREPSAMYWVIFMPIFWMVVLGFAFSKETVERYGIFLIDSPNPTNALLIDALAESQTLMLRRGSEREAHRALIRGQAVLTIELMDHPLLSFDPNNREAKIASREVMRVLEQAAGRVDLLEPAIRHLTVPGQRYVDWLIPGLLGLSIMSTSLFGIGMTIVANRRDNLLKRLCATPLPKHEYLVSHLLGRLISLTIEIVAVVGAGFLIFDFAVQGSFVLFLAVALSGMFCFTSIAMLCGAKTKSLPMISGVTNLLMVVMVMTSGVFFAKTNYPDVVQPMIDLIPLTALVDALRIVALEGAGVADITRELAVLVVGGMLSLVIAIRRFVWY